MQKNKKGSFRTRREEVVVDEGRKIQRRKLWKDL